jgi:putative oxidoreductase
MWTLNKLLNPAQAGLVFKSFYSISGLSSTAVAVIGGIEMIINIGFLAGFKKKWTYGVVLILHGITTIVSYKQYLSPFTVPNLLFFAAWPMLAACFALYVLRDQDTMWVIEK